MHDVDFGYPGFYGPHCWQGTRLQTMETNVRKAAVCVNCERVSMSCGIHLTELDYILAATNSEIESAYLRWRKTESMGSPYRVDEIWMRNRER